MQVGEFVYVIDPHNGEVKESKVVKSLLHPKTQNRQVWLLEIYNVFKVDIDQDSLERAQELTGAVTRQFLVQKDDNMVVTATKIPTVIATEKKELLKWMNQTGPTRSR